MPIKPENLALYPANWKTEIRPRILARAGNCCERCKVPNSIIVGRAIWLGRAVYQFDGRTFCAETGELLADSDHFKIDEAKPVKIVLTIAHVHDPDPAACSDENLAAWCQRCHLRHDHKQHQANAAATRRAKKANRELFA
jgi:hypothetical protein